MASRRRRRDSHVNNWDSDSDSDYSSWSRLSEASSSSSTDNDLGYAIQFEFHYPQTPPPPPPPPPPIPQRLSIAVAVAVAFALGLVISPLLSLLVTPSAKVPAAANTINTTLTPTAQPTKAPLPDYMPADFVWLRSNPMAVFNVSRPNSRIPEEIGACRGNVTSLSRRLKKTWHPDKARSQRRRGGEMLESWQLEYITNRLVQMTVWALNECGELPKKPDQQEEDVRDDERAIKSAWYDERMRVVHNLRESGDFTKAQNLEDAANMQMRMDEDGDDMPGPSWESADPPSGFFSGGFQWLHNWW